MSTSYDRWLILVALFSSATGCERAIGDLDLERMIRQRKCIPYDTCRWLPGDRTMQPTVPGTVPRSRTIGDPALTKGVVDGEAVSDIPLEIDAARLRRGRQRFEIFCAACHGVLGDGVTKVAENMHLRKPPNLHEPRIVAHPPGQLFRIVTQGYGLMPSFDPELSVEDRWAVVAYVQALQLSQHVVLADEPEHIRNAILQELQ
jgi:mono/diheme cytochrome c family protein